MERPLCATTSLEAHLQLVELSRLATSLARGGLVLSLKSGRGPLEISIGIMK
jgi:hypothetical protein